MLRKSYRQWIEHQAYIAMMINSIFLIVFGAWIANPYIDSFVGKPTYHVMNSIAPESIWGGAFFVLGVIKLISSMCAMYRTARTTTLCIFSLWFIVAGAMVSSSSSSPTIPIILYLMVQAGHHYFMINHNQNLPLESN